MTTTRISILLAASTLISSAVLSSQLFPRAHDALSAFALSGIAVAWLLWKIAIRASPMDLMRAAILATAFLFWAANQFWPASAKAGLFNDLAVGLFVLDVFLSIRAERRNF